MIIPPGIGKHIIGKKGKTITEIKSRNHVQITTGEPRQDGETMLTITGNTKDKNQAITEITELITKHLEKDAINNEMKSKNQGNICKYYIEGLCKYGDKCWRDHPQTQHTRTPSPTREA